MFVKVANKICMAVGVYAGEESYRKGYQNRRRGCRETLKVFDLLNFDRQQKKRKFVFPTMFFVFIYFILNIFILRQNARLSMLSEHVLAYNSANNILNNLKISLF